MKKQYFIFAAIIILIINSQNSGLLFAQDVSIGVQGGLSIPSLKGGNSEQSKGYKSRFGPDFGVFTGLSLSKHFGLQVNVSYVAQGGVKKGIQPIPQGNLDPNLPVPTGTIIYGDYKNVAILNYIEIPILIKYSFDLGKLFKLYIDAGPNTGFLVEAKTKTSGTSQLFIDNSGTPLTVGGQALPAVDFSHETDIKSDINVLNFGLAGGLGISTKLGPGDIILDGRGSFGLTPIQKDPKNGNNRTGCLVISLGYAIKI